MSEQIASEAAAKNAEAEAALLQLDGAIDSVVAALQECARHVDNGTLDPSAVMLKMHELMGKLAA